MNQGRKPFRIRPLLFCLAVSILAGCSSSDKEKSTGPAPPVEVLYNNGLDALNERRYTEARDQFNLLEQNYPFSSWALNAQIMEGYSEYLQNNYTDAIATWDRFIQLHPAYHDIAYIYYMRALSYYEQIADIQRDQKGTEQAMTALQEVVTRFPGTPYASDARLKIDLCRDHMAGKEMEIGRYYQGQHLYEAAIGRFQRVVDEYQTTAHVPEALERLVEIYLALGLVDQAKRTAAVLGYNDPGSEWYQEAYNDLAASGAISEGLPTPSNGSRGFFGRAWHALF
jgi:outer membrane protein assembly factor BamD